MPVRAGRRQVRPVADAGRESDGGTRRLVEYSSDLFDARHDRAAGARTSSALLAGAAGRARPARSASCRCCARPSARAAASSGTPPRPPYPSGARCTSCSTRQVGATPGGGRRCASKGDAPELPRARRARPNRLAHHLRAARASGRSAWSASAWSGRWSWWWRCSASSRRAAPTCRSIPPTRPSAWLHARRTPAPRVVLTQAPLAARCRLPARVPGHGARRGAADGLADAPARRLPAQRRPTTWPT